ncbi:hypothetical protein W97_04210 [Coniosporium apollinis CBS 100218]|uniref:C2H2-type domain-containing protein n=1 Tax=Coniosporium apollinis (strain CBS 100218) TaxID=1168221 RepID=R7YSV2_CONA1|nr:uncharacterized protein W97_04210 [Coniosporium apollinis CBS 100218]EON64975.1 hypothetical protein W97_04210 [Coniosporium apollinis CBS 100218]
MAAASRALTPTQTGPLSSTTVAPDTPISISPNEPTKQPTWHPPLSPSGIAGLKASLSPKSPRIGLTRLSPQPLTGAAALADERRLREEQLRGQARQLSPNPGFNAVKALLGAANPGMSKARDAPSASTMSEPLARVAKSITIPENGSVDSSNMQTSPVSLASFGSLEGATAPTATATAIEAPALGSLSGTQAPMVRTPEQQNMSGGILSSAGEDIASSNRAFTLPAPAPHDPSMRPPTRNMSLPMPGFGQNSPKSPSTKRHKCPYCSTDFTRHHNLKSHLLTHSQEKPYECTTCQARFRRLHDLKRHTKLHTGERPHTCSKCGRRFARGDALARHTKGQGGCAGRRSSFEELADGKGGEAMEGLEYEGDDDERMDDEEPENGRNGGRRESESSHAHNTRQASTSAPYQNRMPSTYPPLAGHLGSSGSKLLYPPGSSSSRDPSTLSSRTTGSTYSSSIHFPGQAASVFAQGGMTESPKPLSPGQPDPHQQRPGISETANHAGGRSPAEQFQQQQQFGRGISRHNSSSLSHPPHLPSLPGLGAPERRMTGPPQQMSGGAQPAPNMLHQPIPPPPAMGSNASSLSSQTHHTGSGASMPGGREQDMWARIHELEVRLMQQSNDYDAKLSRLAEENSRLRERIGSLENALLHRPQHPSPHLQQQQQQQQQQGR